MPIKYKADTILNEIIKTEIKKETQYYVIFPNNSRAEKESVYHSYVETKEAAKDFLLKHWNKEIESKQKLIENMKVKRRKILDDCRERD